MNKSDFVARFWYVVKKIQEAKPATDSVCWSLAVKHGHEEGLGITANDSIIENKVLSNLIDVSKRLEVSTTLDVLGVMFFVEQAWEYYQEKVVLPQPVADPTTGGVRFNEFWRR